jgi:hypothetical protein
VDEATLRKNVPDFAFAKRANGSNPREYGIVFESCYAEPSTHAKDKTTDWFSVPSIVGVVILKFDIGKLSPPTTPPDLGAVPDTYAAFVAGAHKALGPIEYKGGTWAPTIKNIHISIYYRDALDVCGALILFRSI